MKGYSIVDAIYAAFVLTTLVESHGFDVGRGDIANWYELDVVAHMSLLPFSEKWFSSGLSKLVVSS